MYRGMADGNEVQALREQLFQVRQVAEGVKEAVVYCVVHRRSNKKAGRFEDLSGYTLST